MYRFGSVLGAFSLTVTLTLAQEIAQQKFLLTQNSRQRPRTFSGY